MLREMHTFIAVCRCGTFTEAARQLGMTQSAVSGHIQRLEAFVGASLFHRTGRSATPNAAGQAMLPMAEEAVLHLDRLRHRAEPGVLRGTVRVGTISSLHATLLARAMVRFRALHPLVSLRINRRDEHMVGQVERAEFDLGVTSRPFPPLTDGLSWQPLFRKPFVLIAPAGCRARNWKAAALAHPLLRYDESSEPGREVGALLRRNGITPPESIWVNYLDVMIQLVAQGVGVAILPRTGLGEAAAAVREYTLGKEVFHREVGVVRRASPPNGGPAADALVEILKQESAQEPFALLAG